MSRRMLMLDVLAESAKKLSELHSKEPKLDVADRKTPAKCENKLLKKLNQEMEERNNKDAQRIIRERLLSKTRKLATRTKPLYEDSSINRFSEVAGWFFFPLVEGFGKKQMIFTSGTNMKYDTDNLLIVKFINTISVIMLCAENSLVAPKMAREMFKLSIFLRYHKESRVRLAVMHMIAAVLIAIPSKLIAMEFPNEINEFSNHLQLIIKSTVVNYEPDKDCREFAKQLIAMCQNSIYFDQ